MLSLIDLDNMIGVLFMMATLTSMCLSLRDKSSLLFPCPQKRLVTPFVPLELEEMSYLLIANNEDRQFSALL